VIDGQRRWDDAGQPAMTVREMVLQHDVDIEALKQWRDELRGAMALVKITLGSSIVAAIVSIAAVVALLNGVAK
jgi:hypothetical protein